MLHTIWNRKRRSLRPARRGAVVGVASLGLLASILVGASPASASTSDTVSGGAFGIDASLLGLSLLSPTPSVTLPANGAATHGDALGASVPGLLSTGDVTAATGATGVGTAAETVTSSASVANLDVSAANLLTAGAVSSSCTSNALGSTASIAVTNLDVLGTIVPVGDDTSPNFNLVVPGLSGVATITLNKQTVTNTVGATSLTVDALQITLLGVLNPNTVINVAQSTCGAAGSDINLPPTIASNGVNPSSGPAIGGTTITVTGTGFGPGTTLTVGGQPATDVTPDAAGTSLTAVTPAGTAGPADVTVTTPVGSASDPTGFTYIAAPTIATTDGVTPSSGPIAGGTTVTITGTNLTGATAVTFGGTPATGVTVVNPTAITATTPAHAAGPADVSVTTPGGTVADPGGFTYDAVPTISADGVSPNVGPLGGGTHITITGTGFAAPATVTVGGTPATGVTVVSPIEITATTPAGTAGAADVTVTTPGGAVTDSGAFTYTASPTIATVGGVVPDAGPLAGGTPVTINGANLTGAATVEFDGVPATDVTVVSPTEITATTPAGIVLGPVNVTVTTPGGPSTDPDGFTYESAPTIATTDGVTPDSGPTAGGTAVTITGTNLLGTTSVTFGGTAATSFTVNSATSVTAITPAGAAGPVDVTVSTTSAPAATDHDGFTYVAPPTINATDGVTPDSGPTTGGTPVTITGTGFTGATAITFGGVPATQVLVSPDGTSIDATTPAGTAGPADVSVTTPGGTATDPGAFTYVGRPTITTPGGINPDAGPTTGGTTVTIIGTGFTPDTTVTVGGQPATDVTPNAAGTSLTAVTPAGTAGPADVKVTTAEGSTTDSGGFTYDAVPMVGTVSPGTGSTSGGTPITIEGTGFAGPAAVTIGSSPATDVTVVSPTEMTAETGPGTAGTYGVTVATPGGSSTGGQFVYAASVNPPPPNPTTPPVVNGITPTSGAPAGGNPVEVVGTGLCGVTSVTFGGTPGTDLSVNSACTIITVDAPAGSGTVAVVVNGPGGAGVSPTSYTYIEPGYWMLASDGGVFSFGGAQFYGSEGGQKLNEPIVTMADTPDHKGYWLFAADGGVFSFGDAKFYGSVPGVLQPGQKLNAPVVAAEATPDGKGYRLFAADGGVFDFGDASFVGSLPGIDITPNKPIVAAVSAPIGQGYVLVAGDGGIFTFGDGNFEGSLGGQSASGIVSISETASGNGYWIFSNNGAVHSFGDAVNYGSEAGVALNKPIAFGVATTTSAGYWLFGVDGGVFTFGDAPFLGSLGGLKLNEPILGGIGF
jgi:hypothetical protein